MNFVKVVVAVFILTFLGWKGQSLFTNPIKHPKKHKLKDLQREKLYEITDDQGIDIRLLPKHSLLKIVAYANILQQNVATAPKQMDFTILYQIVNDQQQVIQTQEYNFSIFSAAKKQYDQLKKMYEQPALIPVAYREFLVQIPTDVAASEIKITALRKHPLLHNLFFELSYRERMSDSQIAYSQQKMLKEKSSVTGNVYPAYLLTEYERKNFLRYSWKSLLPEGRNYKVHYLFTSPAPVK